MTYLLSSRKFSDGLVPNASVETMVLFEFNTMLFESETLSTWSARRSREPGICYLSCMSIIVLVFHKLTYLKDRASPSPLSRPVFFS
jgi:hypothetical protein